MREAVSALDPQRAHLLGIAAGLWATQEDLHDYQRKYRVAMPLTLDASGGLFREFGITEVPAALVIDPQGRILKKLAAADAARPAALGEAVGAL
jgi:hypothetical protein